MKFKVPSIVAIVLALLVFGAGYLFQNTPSVDGAKAFVAGLRGDLEALDPTLASTIYFGTLNQCRIQNVDPFELAPYDPNRQFTAADFEASLHYDWRPKIIEDTCRVQGWNRWYGFNFNGWSATWRAMTWIWTHASWLGLAIWYVSCLPLLGPLMQLEPQDKASHPNDFYAFLPFTPLFVATFAGMLPILPLVGYAYAWVIFWFIGIVAYALKWLLLGLTSMLGTAAGAIAWLAVVLAVPVKIATGAWSLYETANKIDDLAKTASDTSNTAKKT